MTIPQAIFLFFAGALGGAMNAVAGGGSFIGFPALLFTGVPPVSANATNTISLWLGTAASGGAYRKRLDLPRRILVPLLLTSIIGGLIGAELLIRTPTRTFLRLIPWLMLAATLLFTFARRLTPSGASAVSRQASNASVAGASIFELLVAVYGGYFGGGIGIMNLAMLSAVGMTDIHTMNALKVVLAAAINGVATIIFIVSGSIAWIQAVMMTLGAVCGGYSAAHYAQKLPQRWVRAAVIAIGLGMTAYFFWKAYHT